MISGLNLVTAKVKLNSSFQVDNLLRSEEEEYMAMSLIVRMLIPRY